MTTAITGGIAGHQAAEYLNLGTYETPVWTRITRVEDVDLPDERGSADYRIKGSSFVRTIRGARTKSVAFKYRRKLGADTVFDELKDGFETDGVCVEYAACDRPIAEAGATGFRGPFVVTKFSETRPYENVVEVDVELKFADAEHPTSAPDPWEIEPFVTASS